MNKSSEILIITIFTRICFIQSQEQEPSHAIEMPTRGSQRIARFGKAKYQTKDVFRQVSDVGLSLFKTHGTFIIFNKATLFTSAILFAELLVCVVRLIIVSINIDI